jgi:hypothetical protein
MEAVSNILVNVHPAFGSFEMNITTAHFHTMPAPRSRIDTNSESQKLKIS